MSSPKSILDHISPFFQDITAYDPVIMVQADTFLNNAYVWRSYPEECFKELSLPHWDEVRKLDKGLWHTYVLFIRSLRPAKITIGKGGAITCDSGLFTYSERSLTRDEAKLYAILARLTDKELEKAWEDFKECRSDPIAPWVPEYMDEQIRPTFRVIKRFRKTKTYDILTGRLRPGKQIAAIYTLGGECPGCDYSLNFYIRDLNDKWAVVFAVASSADYPVPWEFFPWPIGFIIKGKHLYDSLACLLFSNPCAWVRGPVYVCDAEGVAKEKVKFLTKFIGNIRKNRPPEVAEDLSKKWVQEVKARQQKMFVLFDLAAHYREFSKDIQEKSREETSQKRSDEEQPDFIDPVLEKKVLEAARRISVRDWLNEKLEDGLEKFHEGGIDKRVLVADLEREHVDKMNRWFMKRGLNQFRLELYLGHSFVSGIAMTEKRRKSRITNPHKITLKTELKDDDILSIYEVTENGRNLVKSFKGGSKLVEALEFIFNRYGNGNKETHNT